MSEIDMQPPDPVCRFCEDWCGGTCEGAREAMRPPVSVERIQALIVIMAGGQPSDDDCVDAGCALKQLLHQAARYQVVRSHSADVTPEEMDRGADAIIAAMQVNSCGRCGGPLRTPLMGAPICDRCNR